MSSTALDACWRLASRQGWNSTGLVSSSSMRDKILNFADDAMGVILVLMIAGGFLAFAALILISVFTAIF